MRTSKITSLWSGCSSTCRIRGTQYNYRKKLIATDEGTRHDNSAVWLNRKPTGTVSVEGVELSEQ